MDVGIDADTPWSYATNFATVVDGAAARLGVVLAAIGDLLDRHEGLRTLLPTTGAGGREQHVLPAAERLGEVVRVAPAGPEADQAIAAAAATAFRLAEQQPVLFVLEVAAGTVHRIGIVVDHSAVDGWGMRVLRGDLMQALRSRTSGRAAFAGRPAPEQPLETAEWEASEPGRSYAERAETHWRRQLDALRDGLTGWRPDGGTAPPDPVLQSRWLASAHAARAAQTVATRTGLPVSAIYLTAFGSAISLVEGSPCAGIRSLAANRLSAATQASVRKAVMPVPVLVPGTGDLPARLAATASNQLHGHRFANLDPAIAAAHAAEVLGDLAGTGAATARFNYIDASIVGSAANSRSLGAEAIPFTDPAVQDRITEQPDRPGGSRYILSVQHRPSAALLTIACHSDTTWAPAAADMLRHVEDMLIRASE
ncbi:condensation domain-containing protein [Dactylosporangium sp. NBC_01737]|uniref:condensation domain-containing protein n=1 Tax=Dactylosporangium sp. NBC_01737 TaxID=2975959 RepID=UPI002E0D9401|nr:condensation domain-containing protein [Dactylosporangium sp. NBC_01737]